MKQKNNKLFIGLTGGIGSGKTTVANCFRKLGADVFDADEISRNALSVNGPCVQKTVRAFGKSVLCDDGSINRKALSAIVFNDEKKRVQLNGIIHPYVVHELLRKAYDSDKSVIVFDVPLLYECGLDRLMDANIAVYADAETRITRVMERNHISREEVVKRISSQQANEKHFKEAGYTLENMGTREELQEKAEKLLMRIKESYR